MLNPTIDIFVKDRFFILVYNSKDFRLECS